MSLVTLPVMYVPDPTKGKPLFYGQVYAGAADLDPEVDVNQTQLYVIQEDGTQVPVIQPFILSSGGVPEYNGAYVRLAVSEDNYSLKILDKQGAQKYYFENVSDSGSGASGVVTSSEYFTLSAGQTTVDLSPMTAASAIIYINSGTGGEGDRGQLFKDVADPDYTVTGSTEIELSESYEAGTVLKVTSSQYLPEIIINYVKAFDTVDSAINDKNLEDGDTITISERLGSKWLVVLTESVNPDGYGVIESVYDPTLSFVLEKKAVIDAEEYGVSSDADEDFNSGALEAAIFDAVSSLTLEVRLRGRYSFARKINMNTQGLLLNLGSKWGTQLSLNSTSDDDCLIEVTARLCAIKGGLLLTADDKNGIYLKTAQLFDLDSTTIKGSLNGVYHEEGNSVTCRAVFIESCTYGWVMEGTGDGNVNGCTLQGRSINCEIGFDIRENQDPSGSENPTMHNEIFWSTEANTIGFKQRDGRYNYLHVYSESNNRASTEGNTNANFDTDGSPNIWFTRNPDNQEDIIQGAKGSGWQTIGDSVYHVAGKIESVVKTVDFSASGSLNYDGRVFNITNSSGSTRALTLNFISNMGIGDTISVFKLDNTEGFTLSWDSGTLLGDTGTFGAFATEVKEMRITRIDSTNAIINQL